MSHLIRSARVPLIGALVLLLMGGVVLGTSLRSQQEVRDELTMLRIANDNLELVMQARIDELRGQNGLAMTPADDDALAGHVDLLRELAPDTSGPGLEEVLAREAAIGTPEEAETGAGLVAIALDSLQRDTTVPVIAELNAAETRSWWAFWVTGLTVVALLSLGLVRGRHGDLGVAGAAGSINPRFTDV